MDIKITQVKCTGKGIKQNENIVSDILSVSEIDGNLYLLTKRGETTTILNYKNDVITKILIS